MIRSPLRPEGFQQHQQQRRLWQQQQELQQQKQQQLDQLQQHNQQQQQLQQHSLEHLQLNRTDASSAAPRLSAVAAASPISHSGHNEWVGSAASPPSAASANNSSSNNNNDSNSSSSSVPGMSISAIGNEMMRRLEEDCEAAARGAPQLEELATESARLQAEVEDLNASEH
ncbi:hypothetical protein Emag_000956 [Eimeria magna]